MASDNSTPLSLGSLSPDLCFGLIADIHYIDYEDGTNYDKTKIRRFR